MRFEGRLAKRYIFAQKRHSLLTICSIAIAVAALTMVFVLAQTLFSSKRTHLLHTDYPHHVLLTSQHRMPEEMLRKLRACPVVKDADYFEPDAYYSPEQEGADRSGYLCYAVYDIYCGAWKRAEQGQPEEDVPSSFSMSAGQRSAFVPDKDARPIWVDFRFVLKEDYAEPFRSLNDFLKEYSDLGIAQMRNGDLLMFDWIGFDGKFSMLTMLTLCYVLTVLFMLCLRMVIDTAFEISSKERERQFGVLQSIGATKKQIRRIITHEGRLLSIIGIPLGLAAGIGFAYLTYRAVLSTNVIYWTWGKSGMQDVHFKVGIVGLAAAALTGLLWVRLSSSATGTRMLKKKTPIESVRASQSKITKVKKHSVFGLLFGWVGGLAARNVRRNRKRYAVTVLSLAVSLTLVAIVPYAADSFRKFMTRTITEISGIPGKECDISVCGYAKERGALHYKELVSELEETGFFSRVSPNLQLYLQDDLSKVSNPEDVPESEKARLTKNPDNNSSNAYILAYLSEEEYRKVCGDTPAVPYSQLKEKGGYVLIKDPSPEALKKENMPIRDGKMTLTDLTLEESEETKSLHYVTGWDAEHNEETTGPGKYVFRAVTIEIAGEQEYEGNLIDKGYTYLISATEEYDRTAWQYDSDCVKHYICVDLKDESYYQRAKDWARDSDHFNIEEYNDFYPELRMVDTYTAAVDMTFRMLSVLFSLIAAVSMINVISTGILNRKNELAGLQSVGMTKRQLNRLMLCECFQFVTGGIAAAAVICCAAVYGMRAIAVDAGMPEWIEKLGLSYTKPITVILIAGACAFAVAMLAAFLPLRRMQKEPIVDSLRGFD